MVSCIFGYILNENQPTLPVYFFCYFKEQHCRIKKYFFTHYFYTDFIVILLVLFDIFGLYLNINESLVVFNSF
tara:strand:- start:4999 stop:5217 length:219 start_codon:yes stop_codon:yes gene_type:complete